MEVIEFSPNSEYLAISGADGHLRVWETATSKLWHEFIPSSHLVATCTCLSWAPTHVESTQVGKKKKRKRAIEGHVVAMGTVAGSLVLYDVSKAEVVAQSAKTVTTSGNINAMSWSPWNLSIYTCGADGSIREWDPETASLVSHWTASKENLTAIQALKGQLLVGGQTVTLWDLVTKKSVASFTGHPSQIFQVQIVPGTDYFVSLASGDRHLKIWNTKQTYAVASLSIPEPATAMRTHTAGSGEVFVSVTSKKGHLHIFKQKLNGQIKKPIMPTSNIKIIESANSSEIRILAGCVCDVSNPVVLAAYGDWLRLQFEKFDLATLSKENVFPRQLLQVRSKKSKQKSITDENHAEVPNDVKHLQPGTEAVLQVPKGKKSERKEKVEEGDLPMEERLTNLTVDAPSRNDIPTGENLGHLLSQGLHSKDQRILQSVLHRSDEKLILSTVRSLPVQLILPLIEEIKIMLTGKSQLNHSPLKWLKALFQIHSSYLMCCSVSDELMGPIVALLNSRETLYPQMCLLKGKLELVKGHVAAKQYKADVPNEALLTYQDESSDDEDKQDEGLLQSESEEFLTSDDLDLDAENSDDELKIRQENEEESDDTDSSDDEGDEDIKTNGVSHSGDESMEED